jgi:protein phosphatase 1G
MEDSSIMNADLTDDCSVFGIFDGHGGREVALYVEKHFIEEFSKNINFKNGNISEALTDVFLRMDDMMRTNEGWNEVLSLRVS